MTYTKFCKTCYKITHNRDSDKGEICPECGTYIGPNYSTLTPSSSNPQPTKKIENYESCRIRKETIQRCIEEIEKIELPEYIAYGSESMQEECRQEVIEALNKLKEE